MPSKKKKYNARFPAGRIKKIMQSDEEIGKVAQAVPVIISRTLELFVESLLRKTLKITNSRNAKTLSPSHMKQCIMSENRFDFLRELVKNIPDISVAEEVMSNDSSPEATIDQSDTPYDLSMPSTSNCNEIKTQQVANPSNGTIQFPIRSNGVTRSCGTTIVASSLQLQSGNGRVPLSEDKRTQLKRNCDAIAGRLSNFDSIPTKLFRADSAPAGIKLPTITQSGTVTSTATAMSQNEHHQNQHQQQPQQPNQLLPTDLRRLRHQPKSVPGNICVDNNALSLTTKNNSNSSSISHPQTPTTAIPAPIVSIDFCNKPIVKIDYSNLALHDTAYSESQSSSSSSSSPPDDEPNKKSRAATCIAKTSIQPATGTADGPVINIDLSNIVTSGTFATTSVHPSVISSNYSQPTAVVSAPALKTDKNSYLELDEDYDNI